MSATTPDTIPTGATRAIPSQTVSTTMRAAIFRGPGQPLVVERIRTPAPAADEVLIEVAGCGVCHTDLHVIKGEVGFVSPAVLGHEIAGTVVAIGSAVPAHLGLALGSAVVGAFIMPCGDCPACAAGRDDLCDSFFANNRLRGVMHDGRTRLFALDGSPIGMYSMGGLAEYAVVPATGVTALPSILPLENSAVLGCAALTAYGAVRNAADLRTGESVVVVAAGGVGSNILQVARAFGANPVIAVDISTDKLAAAAANGATHTVDGSQGDAVEQVRELTGGRGVDVAFEALGTPRTFRQASDMLRDGGRLVAVGIAAGTSTAEIEITRLVRRSQRITGSYGARVRTDLPEVVRLAAAGMINPHGTVSRTFSLDEADLAFRILAAGGITGRATIRP